MNHPTSNREHSGPGLTKNQAIVMNTLQQSEEPLSAYSILDRLRDEGLRAPLQVYRALDKLVEFGMVHRLESLNAFVACQHPHCESHEIVSFMICDRCSGVDEISDDHMSELVAKLGNKEHFNLRKATIELRGICKECRSKRVSRSV